MCRKYTTKEVTQFAFDKGIIFIDSEYFRSGLYTQLDLYMR